MKALKLRIIEPQSQPPLAESFNLFFLFYLKNVELVLTTLQCCSEIELLKEHKCASKKL